MRATSAQAAQSIHRIMTAQVDNFVELVHLAGLDPKTDFRYTSLCEVDFQDCNLENFDFSGTVFKSCSFKRARISGARFESSQFERSDLADALDWKIYSSKQVPTADWWRQANFSGGGRLRQPLNDQDLLIEAKIGSVERSPEVDLTGCIVCGKITSIYDDEAVIDIGSTSEARVPLREFKRQGQQHVPNIKIGDEVEVYVEAFDRANGKLVLSVERARRERAWNLLEGEFEAGNRVDGVIFGRVKGGFTVDLGGAVAFLPGSQVDVRQVRDVAPLMDIAQPFVILKMDRKRGNIVVSRRAILEETRAEQRTGLIQNLAEGQIIDGVVKNITDYGAFIDLGGIDGLLHVTDISYKRINHPSEVINIGDTVKVQIVRINKDTQRISLGMKQLESDPWDAAVKNYPVGTKLKGSVTNITEYGAFIELEPGIEGLVHVSEMSWTKKNVHPGKIVSTSQEVDVIVLDIDMEKRRISLGLKQAQDNPWASFAEKFPVGSTVEGEVKNATEFGLFIGLDGDVDGMVHMSDIAWGISGEEALHLHRKGETVKAIVLDIDAEKERISLGIKQLERGTLAVGGLKKGATVTVTVLEVRVGGLEVQAGEDGAIGFIKRADLGRDRDEQRPDRFQVGQKLDALVTGFNHLKKPNFSIKALQLAEEMQAVEQYGPADSSTSFGDILGKALKGAKK